MSLARVGVVSGVVPVDRELAADEREEIQNCLAQGYRLAELDPQGSAEPDVIVRAINELVRDLRADRPQDQQVIEFSVALGALLGEQWCRELDWEWRVVIFGQDEGYGVVPADRRYVYLPLQDIYQLFLREEDELNLMLLFNLVADGSLPPAADRQYVSLG